MYENYFVYIITNTRRTVLYTGVTNDLESRLIEHYINRGKKKTFTGRYYCYYLLYFEEFESIGQAIDREKQIKRWSRKKKEALINRDNPEWRFLNVEIMEWPPPLERQRIRNTW